MVEKLMEIKKGQTGRGFLIENEGVLSLNENTKRLCEGVEDEKWFVPHPFIVDAVFQKYGIENANGRIYPENILKREVDKYQIKIQERRAYGECYTPDAWCLTEKGWKPLPEVSVGEKVLTLNPETLEIEYQAVVTTTKKMVNDIVFTVKGKYIDDTVTPNHSYPIFLKDKKYEFDSYKTARELESMGNKDKYFIPVDEKLTKMESVEDLYFGSHQYNGFVYCIEVPNHIWFVKQNEKSHWTKNCNHPSESVIDLGRICMNIVELHWEKQTLVGKMEIETSRAFRQLGAITCLGDMIANHLLEGYKIGVSSRGIGSVEQRMGKLVVGDDFELICWDVVSDPSTPSAWICPDGINKMYVETTENKKPVINEKLDKIESLLIDF